MPLVTYDVAALLLVYLDRAHLSTTPCFVGVVNEIKAMVILDRPNQFLQFNWKMRLVNKS